MHNHQLIGSGSDRPTTERSGMNLAGDWLLSGSSDPRALDVVDGTGRFVGQGPHYSRRTPGSKTFTGVGQEVVLVHPSGAVWACVRQRVPAPRGSGASRGRTGETAPTAYVWRNMMFRNLGSERASDLIRSAVVSTAWAWVERYGALPAEDLRTEIKRSAIRSEIPGYSYRRAGWVKCKTVRDMVYLRCPRPQLDRALLGIPRPEPRDLALLSETCLATHSTGAQCRDRMGHSGAHDAGDLLWGNARAVA
jgi:hypothetical protein